MRTGTGTVRRFIGDPNMAFIGLERNGNIANLVVAPDLVQKLLDVYGVRDNASTTSMATLIGLKCRWTEDACGQLVGLEPLDN